MITISILAFHVGKEKPTDMNTSHIARAVTFRHKLGTLVHYGQIILGNSFGILCSVARAIRHCQIICSISHAVNLAKTTAITFNLWYKQRTSSHLGE